MSVICLDEALLSELFPLRSVIWFKPIELNDSVSSCSLIRFILFEFRSVVKLTAVFILLASAPTGDGE